MELSKLSSGRKWSMIIFLAFFGRAIANVPYLREVYYDQVIEALQISNTQLGILSSAVGIASLFGYFFGGFLADKFSTKKIVMLSGLTGGAATFWYTMMPPFPALVFIHAAVALSGTLLFWSAYVRILRLLGGSEGQGKYYGFSEGIRATIGIILPLITTSLMQRALLPTIGFRNTLIFYAVLYAASGIIAPILIVDIKEEDVCTENDKPKFHAKDYLDLFKTPGVWLVAFLIFGAYTVFSLQAYSTPYMTNVYGMPNSLVSTVASFRQYGVGLLGMPLFGILADSVIKSSTKVCLIGGILLVPCAIGMLLCPQGAGVLLIVLVLAIGFLVSGVRGIYYATQNEAQVPIGLAGAAAGIISTIGFLPDAFIFTQVGAWLDKYPAEQAYRMIWIYMIIGCAVAIAASIGILFIAHRHEKQNGNIKNQ